MNDAQKAIRQLADFLSRLESERHGQPQVNDAPGYDLKCGTAHTYLTPVLPSLQASTGNPAETIREALSAALASLGTTDERPWADFRRLLSKAIEPDRTPPGPLETSPETSQPTRTATPHPITPCHFVVLIHGIRTQAEWAEAVASTLKAEGFLPVPLRYQYFSAPRFLIPFPTLRRRGTQRLIMAVRDLRRDHPSCRISVIAHSFGSYCVGQLLKREFDLVLHRIVLAGSVLDRGFPWHRLTHQFTAVINDCGSRDIWPVLAEGCTWGYGASGTFGFGHPRVTDRFHRSGHSDLLRQEFADQFWLPFLKDGTVIEGPSDRERTPWLSFLDSVKPKWLALLAVVASLAFSPLGPLIWRSVDMAVRSRTHVPPSSSTDAHRVDPAPILDECVGLLTKERRWKGEFRSTCDAGPRPLDRPSLRLDTVGAGFVVVERYSALIQVQPNQVYTVTYSVKSELEEASADVYGRVVVAEYTVTATENDDLAANRISPGFDHGENVGGVTGWVKKSYAITTQPATRYVRLRAILGGPALEGGARGRLWLHGLEIKKP